jgi:hypothetical protein
LRIVQRLRLPSPAAHLPLEAEFLRLGGDLDRGASPAEELGRLLKSGALSVVTSVDAVPADLIGRKLSPRDVKKLVTSGPKKPAAPSVVR